MKKYFKKTVAVLLILSLLFAMTACSQDANKPQDASKPQDTNKPSGEDGKADEMPLDAWDAETEFLIIGGGVAGLSAAIEAADVGFEDILVIEKLAVLGGSAFVSEGILGGYETIVTKKLDLHIDPKDMFDDQMKEKKYILDPELTWLTTEKSGQTIDWLIEHLGVKFEDTVGTKDGYGNLPVIHIVEGGGPGLREHYNNAINERKAITVSTETRGTELIVEDGAVIGAVAQQGDKTIRIKAGAVMLATGGYNSNHDIIANSFPANRIFQTSMMPSSTGDGLLMATAIGAGTNNLDQIQCYLREYDDPRSQTPYLYNIYVGLEGKRFMDEKRTPQTYNQENRDAVIEQTSKDGTDYFWAINDHAAMTAFGIAEDAQTRKGVTIADTLEELAAAIGVDPEGLKSTVEHWNEMVDNGADSDFGRTRSLSKIENGPFYALKTIFFSSVCHGGITKNAKAEVTRLDGSTIPGLYASGELTAVTNSNGYTISNAITFGRIAAQSAIEYCRNK